MKKIKIRYFISIFLVLLFFICLFSLSTKAQAFKRLSKEDIIIPFTLKNISGQAISIDSYREKSALAVMFWKYPGDRCIEEMNILQELYNQYKEKDFEIIAVYSPASANGAGDDEMSKIYELIADKNYTFQILIDSDLSIYNKYGVLTFPSLALVTKEGKVFEIIAGFPKFSGKKNLVNHVMNMLGIELPKKESKVTRYQPDKKAERYFGIAKTMYNAAFYGKAESNLQRALTIDTGYADAYALLGNVYAKKGNVELAEKNFKISLELDTTNAEIHFDYGIFCRDRNMGECAQAEFEKVLTLNPDSGNGHYGLGTMYRIQKKYDEAISEFEEAIRIFEGNGNKEPNLNLAHTYYELGLIAADLKQEDKSLNKLKQANILYKNIIKGLVLMAE
ncbi:MAG: tetratricopeptide repeat protein [bacterium]